MSPRAGGVPQFHAALVERTVELLGDGEWHEYEVVVRELCKVVPPGPAIRKAEQIRVSSLKLAHGHDAPVAPRQRPKDSDTLIQSGARAVVRSFLGNPRNYEIERPEPGASRRWSERRIRMVRKPRFAHTDDDDLLTPRLVEENRRLRAQVDHLRAYLRQIGHHRAAQRLAPEEGTS